MTDRQRELMLAIAKDPGAVTNLNFQRAGLPFEAFLKFAQMPNALAKERATLALLNQA